MKVKCRLSLFFFLSIAVCAASLFLFVRRSTESLLRSFVFSGDAAKARICASILGDW